MLVSTTELVAFVVVMEVALLVMTLQPVPMAGVENVSLVVLLVLLPLPLPSPPWLAWVEVAATRRVLVFGATLEPLVRRRDRAPRPSI